MGEKVVTMVGLSHNTCELKQLGDVEGRVCVMCMYVCVLCIPTLLLPPPRNS